MALLALPRRAQPWTLAAHTLVGRSSACTLRLYDDAVSKEHASISWCPRAGWELRDLHSSNGTYLDGRLLARGARETLEPGSRLAFGNPAPVYRLLDASPPVALARRLDTQAVVAATEGLLTLPSADAPLAAVFACEDDGWRLELEGETRDVVDGEVIVVAETSWMLHLPLPLPATTRGESLPPRLADVGLVFQVSPDEERVDVELELPGGERRHLPARACYYTFLTIARARCEDEAQGELPAAERGWLEVPALCRMLRCDRGHLNVDVHRVRRSLERAGLRESGMVFQRSARVGVPVIRLGTPRASVIELG